MRSAIGRSQAGAVTPQEQLIAAGASIFPEQFVFNAYGELVA